MEYNYTNYTLFDNDSYIPFGDEEEPETTTPRKFIGVRGILSFCGIAVNVIIISILVFGLVRSSNQRRSPRLWLLLGVISANLLSIVWDILSRFLYYPGTATKDAITSNRVLCIFMVNLEACFDTASVLGSALLVCHIFLWVYEPNSAKEKITLVFWAAAEAATWIVSVAVILGMRAPDTYISSSINPVRKSCTVKLDREDKTAAFSTIFFLLPFLYVLPMALLSLWMKAGNRRYNPIAAELESLPMTSHPTEKSSNDESGKQNESLQNERQSNEMVHGSPASALLPWVIFNIMNTSFGFGLRIPYHLLLQESFNRNLFRRPWEEIFRFYQATFLGRLVYFSFVSLICLVLPEIRKTLRSIFKCCKTRRTG